MVLGKASESASGTEQSEAEITSTMNGIDDDSPWDVYPNPSHAHQSEWSKITSDFINVCHCFNNPKIRNLIVD